MKQFATLFFAFTFYSCASAQIFATTSNGQKVILNMNGTWKYANGTEVIQDPSGCHQTHSGNITVTNNTKNDIYFYYNYSAITLAGTKFVKVKAETSKTIKDIPVDNYMSGRYDWKALLEMSDGNSAIEYLRGIANGNFTVVECSTREVEIDN